MNSRLLLSLAVFGGMAVSAIAQYTSPELMLVTDFGGTLNGITIAPRIERYDPYTGAYLGSFGTGYVTDPTGITIVGQDAYVSNPFTYGGTSFSRIDKFNFSTGAYDGSIFSSSPYNIYGLATYGTYVLASDFGFDGYYAGIYTFNSAGQQTSFYAMPTGSEPESIAADSSHAYVASLANGLYGYNLNSSGVVTSQAFNTGAGTDEYYGVTDYGAGNTVFADGVTSSDLGVVSAYSTAGTLLSQYTTSTLLYDSAAMGHNGMLYALADSNMIQRFDGTEALSFGPVGSFNLADTAVGVRVAVYAAPEPVSTAFLAMGAMGLILRRRSQRA